MYERGRLCIYSFYLFQFDLLVSAAQLIRVGFIVSFIKTGEEGTKPHDRDLSPAEQHQRGCIAQISRISQRSNLVNATNPSWFRSNMGRNTFSNISLNRQAAWRGQGGPGRSGVARSYWVSAVLGGSDRGRTAGRRQMRNGTE